MADEKGLEKTLNDLTHNVDVAGGEIALAAKEMASALKKPVMRRTAEVDVAGPRVELEPDGLSVLERIIDENDLLPAYFLEQGARVQRSVARVVLTRSHGGLHPGDAWATGFMVSPSLFLTNNHVIEELDFARKIRMQFNYQLGADGMDQTTESFRPSTTDVFHTNPALDFTLIRLRPAQVNDPITGASTVAQAGERWGFIELNPEPSFRTKQHFNIIQHPDGRRKQIAIRRNELSELFQHAVRYTADTEPGSSGSPVFDNLWQLVALHHAGGERDDTGKWINNQGIRIDRIVDDLRDHFEDEPEVLDELGI